MSERAGVLNLHLAVDVSIYILIKASAHHYRFKVSTV